MTAAHAYELSPEGFVPTSAVDAAEEGNIVYLTRAGQLIARIMPVDLSALEAEAERAAAREETTAAACRRLWESVHDAAEVTKTAARTVIDSLMEASDDVSDIAAADAAMARIEAGGQTYTLAEIMAEYADDLVSFPAGAVGPRGSVYRR